MGMWYNLLVQPVKMQGIRKKALTSDPVIVCIFDSTPDGFIMNYKNRDSLSFWQLLSTHRLFMFWFLIPRPSEKDNTSFCRWTCQNIFFSETIAGKKWPYTTYKNLCNTTLFACLQVASSKHEKGWENLRQLSKASAMSWVCITSENSPNPPSV